MKRVADFVCALFGLVLLSPVFLAIALVMKFQKNGPVIFRQERIGYKGKPFTIYKFRTLSTVVEDEGPQLIAQCDTVKSTPFERYLREHHLDELPQLWNVLRGDMSLVGPRPERKYFIYQMKPGLTSEATLYNGYTDTIEKMLKRLDMDIRYLENRTLMLDLKIILSTVYAMLKSLPLAGTNGKTAKKRTE